MNVYICNHHTDKYFNDHTETFLQNRSQGSYEVILGPTTAFLRTYHDLVDPDGFAEVKNGWLSLVGTGTEQLDPILSPLGPHTRS